MADLRTATSFRAGLELVTDGGAPAWQFVIVGAYFSGSAYSVTDYIVKDIPNKDGVFTGIKVAEMMAKKSEEFGGTA